VFIAKASFDISLYQETTVIDFEWAFSDSTSSNQAIQQSGQPFRRAIQQSG
jgi:hypothetical protein